MALICCVGNGDVVASTYLYETELFLFAEFLVTNPEFSRRVRHSACLIIAQTTAILAAARGVFVLATPRTPGIGMILARMGFRDSSVSMWVRLHGPVSVYTAPPAGRSVKETVGRQVSTGGARTLRDNRSPRLRRGTVPVKRPRLPPIDTSAALEPEPMGIRRVGQAGMREAPHPVNIAQVTPPVSNLARGRVRKRRDGLG